METGIYCPYVYILQFGDNISSFPLGSFATPQYSV